jgi:hypothetical protein
MNSHSLNEMAQARDDSEGTKNRHQAIWIRPKLPARLEPYPSGLARPVARQRADAFRHEAGLPTPHNGLRLAGATHDFCGASALP